MEADEKEKEASRKPFTLNRVLLLAIMILQVVILVLLYRNHDLPRTTRPPLIRDPEAAIRPPPLEPAGYRAPARATPITHAPHAMSAPWLDEPDWSFPWPVAGGPAQEMHAHMDRMLRQFSEMARVLDSDTGWNALMTSPTMDMRDQGESYVLDFSLPGIDASEIEVSLEGRLLTVYTSVDAQAPSGRSFSRFERKVLLPGPVQTAGSARAMLTNGVLKVIIPKTLEAETNAGPGCIFRGRDQAPRSGQGHGNTY